MLCSIVILPMLLWETRCLWWHVAFHILWLLLRTLSMGLLSTGRGANTPRISPFFSCIRQNSPYYTFTIRLTFNRYIYAWTVLGLSSHYTLRIAVHQKLSFISHRILNNMIAQPAEMGKFAVFVLAASIQGICYNMLSFEVESALGYLKNAAMFCIN